MYFCTASVNSRVMICTLSSAHWQQASKIQPCGALNYFGKIEINAPNSIMIIIIVISSFFLFFIQCSVSGEQFGDLLVRLFRRDMTFVLTGRKNPMI